MGPDHIGIGDRKFLINRLIQQAPINTLVREFFKNADENAALASKGNRLVEIYPTLINGIRKLTFYNTGVGMSASDLRIATDLSSSINKTLSLDGNFGIGAKVSGLAASPEGIRYRSCKNGEVNEVTIGFDAAADTYIRFDVLMPDGSHETIYDVTVTAIRDGKTVDHDWTEVVLMGETQEHDTCVEPIGLKQEVDRSFIATSIFRRFVAFSPGVQVKIDVAMTKGGGKNETGRFRPLRTLDEIASRVPLRFEDVTEKTSGITIRYLHDPKHDASSHSLSARANPATSSTTFCSLVHRDERYDLRTQKVWSSIAPVFGVPFGSKVLTIEIHLPDLAAYPSQYRDTLLWRRDRSSMGIDQYAYLVRELMPEWVKDIIKRESPDNADDLNDLQADLQRLLDEMRVPAKVVRPSARSTANAFSSNLNDAGFPLPERSAIEAEQDEPEPEGSRRSGRRNSDRAAKSRIRLAPDGAIASRISKALERAPEIKILLDPSEIAERTINNRAARFYSEVQTIFVNGLYQVVNRMASELEDEIVDADDPDEARGLIIQAAQRMLAFRVGKATCFALAKRLLDDWSVEDLERATCPESLSMAADDFRQSIPAARRWIKERLRVAKVACLG